MEDDFGALDAIIAGLCATAALLASPLPNTGLPTALVQTVVAPRTRPLDQPGVVMAGVLAQAKNEP